MKILILLDKHEWLPSLKQRDFVSYYVKLLYKYITPKNTYITNTFLIF